MILELRLLLCKSYPCTFFLSKWAIFLSCKYNLKWQRSLQNIDNSVCKSNLCQQAIFYFSALHVVLLQPVSFFSKCMDNMHVDRLGQLWRRLMRHSSKSDKEQVKRGYNIVAEGWAGVSNPHPHPKPNPNPHKYLERLFFHVSTQSPWTDGWTDGQMDRPTDGQSLL